MFPSLKKQRRTPRQGKQHIDPKRIRKTWLTEFHGTHNWLGESMTGFHAPEEAQP